MGRGTVLEGGSAGIRNSQPVYGNPLWDRECQWHGRVHGALSGARWYGAVRAARFAVLAIHPRLPVAMNRTVVSVPADRRGKRKHWPLQSSEEKQYHR